MDINDFDYELPEELIAQEPMSQRDGCRLMVLDREHGTIEHRKFHDIIEYLGPNDIMVMNDLKGNVIHAGNNITYYYYGK